MKNIFLIIVTSLLLSSCASKASFNSFYSENKEDCTFSISTPAFFANLFIPKDDIEEYKDIFKKVKHYKVMVFSEGSISLDKKFDRFVKRKNYSSIFKISQNGDKVQLYFLESKDRIKEILLKVKSDNEFVVLGLKTNISESDFNKIVKKSNIKITSN
ncbi:DUF4252 domain-containing protein [Lutibacter sp.]|uniref:DUF4252 domain-containing protein n=1 Tax=Lutibacter sp. TaxID=1925666 RepID=UPI002733FCF2|nr:DUF4252 domain-containing protein [Lutibacter sp.]MDP3314273.1 DUF4252 domain-containing protein [Lutibacter sp.]